MLTRTHILKDPSEGLKWLAAWGENPDDWAVERSSSVFFGSIFLSFTDRKLRLRYTVDTKENRESLTSELEIVRKWKDSGILTEEYLPLSNGKAFLEEDGYLVVLLETPALPDLTEVKPLPYFALGEALGKIHQAGGAGSGEKAVASHMARISEYIRLGGGDSRAESEAEFLGRILNAAQASPKMTGWILGLPKLTDILYDAKSSKFYFTHLELASQFFFAQDLACIQKSIISQDPDASHTESINALLRGYRSVMEFDQEEEVLLELFRRTASLEEFSYLLYTSSGTAEGETPEQLIERCALFSKMANIGEDFGAAVMGFAPKGDDTPDLELLKRTYPVFYTANLIETCKWYEDVLRFTVHHDQDVEGRNFILASRDKIGLMFFESPNATVHTARELYGDGLDGYFTTAEPEILQAEMQAEGVTIVQELSRTDFSERAFIFEDIDGRRFEVRFAPLD